MIRFVLGVDPGPVESAGCLIATEMKVTVEASIVECVKLANGAFLDWFRSLLKTYGSALTVGIECLVNQGRVVGRETFETAYFIGRLLLILEMSDEHVFDLYTKNETASWLLGAGSKRTDAVIRSALEDRYGPYTNGPLISLRGSKSDKRTAFLLAKYHEFCLVAYEKGSRDFRRSVYSKPLGI